MSKVLTWEEYDRLSKEGNPPPVKINEVTPAAEKPELAQSSNKDYYLMFPDNPVDQYHNGFYHVDSDHTVEIINGIVKTDSEEISNKLIKQGFLFLQSKEKEDE